MKKHFFCMLFVPFLIANYSLISCSKSDAGTGTKSSDANKNYFSLKLSSNIPNVTNYDVNVDDLNKIEEGKEVTIYTTSGYYVIKQFLSSGNELLYSGDSYTFKITKDTEIKLMFTKSDKYYISPKETGDANIILMCGQSNMAGSGETSFSALDQRTIQNYKEGHDNVVINFHSGQNYTFNSASSSDFISVNFGQGGSLSAFGPEVGLAKSLGTNRSNEKYYLVKVAYGGTNLFNQWNIDNIENTSDKYMYGNFVKYLNNVLDMFKTKTNLKPSIKAMLWLQGESDTDTDNGSHAVEYGTHFQKLVNDVKTRYADHLSSDFKWISALISDTYRNNQQGATKENIAYVNTALRTYSDRIVSETESELAKVSTLHYTAQSMLKIGEYFYREIFR